MYEASSDAMNTIALASSSVRPRRPIGTPVTSAALFSGVPVKRVNMPVSVGPGATAFTRIPDLAISRATDDVRAFLGKGNGGGPAYACEASRDQDDWLVHLRYSLRKRHSGPP